MDRRNYLAGMCLQGLLVARATRSANSSVRGFRLNADESTVKHAVSLADQLIAALDNAEEDESEIVPK